MLSLLLLLYRYLWCLGCLHKGQKYQEGDKVATNDVCSSCKCTNGKVTIAKSLLSLVWYDAQYWWFYSIKCYSPSSIIKCYQVTSYIYLWWTPITPRASSIKQIEQMCEENHCAHDIVKYLKICETQLRDLNPWLTMNEGSTNSVAPNDKLHLTLH